VNRLGRIGKVARSQAERRHERRSPAA
jgi:hypothetical protein